MGHPRARSICLCGMPWKEMFLCRQPFRMTLLSLKLSEEVRRQATDLVYTAVRSEVRCLYVLHRIYPKFGHFPKVVQRLLCGSLCGTPLSGKGTCLCHSPRNSGGHKLFVRQGHGAAANWGLRSLLRLEGAPLRRAFTRTRGTGTIFLPSCAFACVFNGASDLLFMSCLPHTLSTVYERPHPAHYSILTTKKSLFPAEK